MKSMASMYCGQAYEELSEDEMRAIDGGGPETVTITTWSSVPCTISGVATSVVVVSVYVTTKD